MTTASPRAVSGVSFSRLRTALLAAASTSLMVAFSAPANAASCATTGGDDSCVITLADIGDTHNGQAGTDTLVFSFVPIETLDANIFSTGASGKFLNFENAVVDGFMRLNDTDALDTGSAINLNWTVDGWLILNLASSVATNDTIGNTSAVTVNNLGLFHVLEDEVIGALTVNGDGEADLYNTTVLRAASLSGDGVVGLRDTSTLSVGSANNTFSGIVFGTGGLVFNGTSKWTLTGDNVYSGTTTVNSGTLEIQNAGAIDQSSAVVINGGEITSKVVANYDLNGLTINGGRLTGNATIHGNVSSNGGLQPGNTAIPPGGVNENPGQLMGTISITGNYTATGTGAYVGSFIDLDAALAVPGPGDGTPGTTHDFFNIDGDYLGANRTLYSHLSYLNNPVGGPTSGDGIHVIRIGGANSGNDFYQATAITAGPYQYLLKHVPNYAGGGGADGYFLQSAVRDELIAHAALLSAGQALVRNCYHDGQRIPDSPKGATYGRAWVGYRQGSTDFGADTGIESNVDYSCTTGGMDWRMGNGWFGGVSGAFGDTEGNIQTPAGTAGYTGAGRSAEVFASFTSESLFINLSAGYNAMDYTYDGALLFPIVADTAGFLARAETGVALDLDALAVKLIGAVSYDGTNCSDSCLGVAVTQDTGLIEAKGTVRIDGVAHGGSVRPWIAASFSDVLSDGINTVSLGAVSVSHDTNGQLLSLDAGLQAYLDQNFALYLDGGYQESLSKDVSGYKAGIGLKMYW